MQTASIVALLLYFLLLAGVVWRTKEQKEKGFVIGGRKIGLLGTTFSQLTSLTDGTGLIIGIMLAASFGFGFLWGIFGAAAGYALLAFQAKKIRTLAGERHYVTISDFLKDRCGKRTESLSAIMISLMAFFALAGQVNIAGVIFSKLLNVQEFWGILLAAITVGGYLWIGGYMNIIRTDLLQGIIIIILSLCAIIFGSYPSFTEMQQQFTTIPKDVAWGFFLFHIPVLYAYFDTWQRLFSAKSPDTAKNATLITALLHIILWLGIMMFGITIAQYGSGETPDQLAYSIFTNEKIWPVIGAGLGVCLLALIMSSLDSRAYTVASTVTSNILKIDPDIDHKKFTKTLKYSFAITFSSIALIAIFINDIVQYMINTASTFALLAPILFLAVHYTPRNKKLFDWLIVFTLIGGCIIWAWLFTIGFFNGFLPNIVPILCVAMLTFIAMLTDRFINARRKNP